MTETTSELGKGGEGSGHGVWQGQAAVDLIALDGRIEANIDISPFEGVCVKVTLAGT